MANSIALLANRRCLVLGAAGFIGTNLCHALRKVGADIIGLDVKTPHPSLAQTEWHKIGFDESGRVEELLQTGDVIFHLVSTTVPGSVVTPDKDVIENVMPTLRLLEACSRKRVARIVFLSSGGTVYGPDVRVPTPEDAPLSPISWYGVQKLTIEKYLAVYRRLHALDSFVLRVSNPFGPHQTNPGQGLIASVIRHALAATPVDIFGDGQVTRDYVYIDDVVDAMLRAAAVVSPAIPRTYNIGTSIGRTISDVVDTVQAAGGKPIRIKRLPSRPIDVPVSILDISLAKTHLDWRPATKWEQAIQLTYSWAKSEHDQLAAR